MDNRAKLRSRVALEDFFSRTGLEEAAREEFWCVPGRIQAIAARIPPHRLSKFQDALPPAAVAEMLGNAFLEVRGARQVLGAR